MVRFADGRRGLSIPGSLVIEIDGNRLTGIQVDAHGNELDRFTLIRRE